MRGSIFLRKNFVVKQTVNYYFTQLLNERRQISSIKLLAQFAITRKTNRLTLLQRQ